MSALSVRPSNKLQSVLLGPPCVYLCRQVDSESDPPPPHTTPSIRPSTHPFTSSPITPFQASSHLLCFQSFIASCSGCVWLKMNHVWHVPSHLMVLLMLPVSPGTPHTLEDWMCECDFIFFIVITVCAWLLFGFGKLYSSHFMHLLGSESEMLYHIWTHFKACSDALELGLGFHKHVQYLKKKMFSS